MSGRLGMLGDKHGSRMSPFQAIRGHSRQSKIPESFKVPESLNSGMEFACAGTPPTDSLQRPGHTSLALAFA